MTSWMSPDFVEIKMDAEIGSYQEDGDPIRGDDVDREARDLDAAAE